MRGSTYRAGATVRQPRSKKPLIFVLAVILIAAAGFGVYKLFLESSPAEKAAAQLNFDASVTETERSQIRQTFSDQNISFGMDVNISASTTTSGEGIILNAYVPVAPQYDSRQNIASEDLQDQADKLSEDSASFPEPVDGSVVLMPVSSITTNMKLLSLDGDYYLDNFTSGAFFRRLEIQSADQSKMLDVPSIDFGQLPSKDSVFKVNQSGVTALTRLMMRKLSSVGDATYFSEKIGDFLADADITHVSNEVSFQKGCQYSNTSFCSPPEFIETLKDSGVDLVEITGNHNNDRGNQYNTETINLYHSLGWSVFGGGLNREEAAKPYVADIKGSKVTFLGYNMADGIGSGAIAGETTAGANFFTEEKAKADIEAAKQNSDFVIVDIQYAECQAYPNGYVEFPICDQPISGQTQDFRNLIDWGADMVVGSSAHQPQTYEFYNGKPIYYGLGNLYFEQTQWPGTERGIILSHYFLNGKLLQTKLTPTVYDRDYQTRIMSEADAHQLFERLNKAR